MTMIETVGFLELNSIAKGVEAADAILKAAQVELTFANFSLLFKGVGAGVKASLDAGMAVGESHVVDSTVIPRVHPQVIEAIHQATDFHGTGAIGVMEFFSITAAVYGADAAVKAANVTLLDVRLGMGLGGKSFVVMTGDVASVKASVEAGSEEGKNNGLLVSSVVIPSPRPEIFESLM